MDIGNIYRKAWEITKLNKALWVFGIALVFLGKNNFNFNQSSSSGDDGFNYNASFEEAKADFGGLIDYGKDILADIPPGMWLLLVVSIVVAIVVGAIFVIFTKNWARGSLIGGINIAATGGKPTLRTSSKIGLSRVKDMIWLNLIPWLFYSMALIVAMLAIAGVFLILPLMGFVFVIPIVLIAIFISICISAAQIWAQRIAIIEGKSGKESLIEGWAIFKSNISNTLILSAVNCLLGCLIGCGVMIVMVFVVGFIAMGFALGVEIGLFLALSIGLIALPLLFLMPVVSGVFVVFEASTWNILYMEIRGLPVSRDLGNPFLNDDGNVSSNLPQAENPLSQNNSESQSNTLASENLNGLGDSTNEGGGNE